MGEASCACRATSQMRSRCLFLRRVVILPPIGFVFSDALMYTFGGAFYTGCSMEARRYGWNRRIDIRVVL